MMDSEILLLLRAVQQAQARKKSQLATACGSIVLRPCHQDHKRDGKLLRSNRETDV